jgi:hypothetical protein
MQLALHFDERVMNQGGQLFWPIAKTLFATIVQLPRPEIASQVLIGSLLLHQRCYERSEERESAWTERFDRERFKEILDLCANPPKRLVCTFTRETTQVAIEGRLFAIFLTSVDRGHARTLDQAFKRSNAYRAAVEVDNTYPPHVLLYSHGLCAFGRIYSRNLWLFWD